MKKILIVDDEKDTLYILEKKLKENNYIVFAATNGKDAIEFSKRENPDLILLDIAMPDMDGYTIASALRKEKLLKDVPIIFVTGKELEFKSMEERLSQFGVCDYIVKPCRFEDILRKVNGFIG
jgi:CheY-like chemotaxis protein